MFAQFFWIRRVVKIKRTIIWNARSSNIINLGIGFAASSKPCRILLPPCLQQVYVMLQSHQTAICFHGLFIQYYTSTCFLLTVHRCSGKKKYCRMLHRPQLTLFLAPYFRCSSNAEMRNKMSFSPWSTRYSSLSMGLSFSVSKEANAVAVASAIYLSSSWDTRDMMQQSAHPNGTSLTRYLEVPEMTACLPILHTGSPSFICPTNPAAG